MNIKNFKFHNTRIKLSNSDYWDFYLSNDDRFQYPILDNGGIISGDSLVLNFDFNNPDIYSSGQTSGTTITSLDTWSDAINSGITLNDIGLTGIDNGLVTYSHNSGDTKNVELTNALLTSTLIIPKENKSFFMTRVTGSTTTTGLTSNITYPIDFLCDENFGQYPQFCGGFYQGFYKLEGFDYQVLPNRVNKAWMMDFWVKPEDNCSGHTGTTLNDLYPDNKGFFFFMGTRAENKFWTIFEGLSTGCTSDCTECVVSGNTMFPSQYCTVPKETNITSSSNYPLSPPPIEFKEITNNFLIYSRGNGHCCGEKCPTTGSTNNWSIDFTGGTTGSTIFPYDLFERDSDHSYSVYDPDAHSKCNVGKRACSHDNSPVYFSAVTMQLVDDRNKFLVFSRSNGCECGKSGHTGTVGERACSYSGDSVPLLELDYQADLVYNAFGFRIKDDGSVGYRLLDKVCLTGITGSSPTIKTTGLTVVENYSMSGVVTSNEWNNITIRWVADITYTDCELGFKPQRNGKLYIYVNARLKLVINDFKEILLKSLYEDKTKQEGVPFNYSLGGGSQGLIESMTFDGQDPDDVGLIIEKNFAGSFIGGISKFRMYTEDIGWCGVKNNFIQTLLDNYNNDPLLIQDNLGIILIEECGGIIIT